MAVDYMAIGLDFSMGEQRRASLAQLPEYTPDR